MGRSWGRTPPCGISALIRRRGERERGRRELGGSRGGLFSLKPGPQAGASSGNAAGWGPGPTWVYGGAGKKEALSAPTGEPVPAGWAPGPFLTGMRPPGAKQLHTKIGKDTGIPGGHPGAQT